MAMLSMGAQQPQKAALEQRFLDRASKEDDLPSASVRASNWDRIVGHVGSFVPGADPETNKKTLGVKQGPERTTCSAEVPFYTGGYDPGARNGAASVGAVVQVDLTDTTPDPGYVAELSAAIGGEAKASSGAPSQGQPGAHWAGYDAPVWLNNDGRMPDGTVSVDVAVQPVLLARHDRDRAMAQRPGRAGAEMDGRNLPVPLQMGTALASDGKEAFAASVGRAMAVQSFLRNGRTPIDARDSDAACREFLGLAGKYMQENAGAAKALGIQTGPGQAGGLPEMKVIDKGAFGAPGNKAAKEALLGGLGKYVREAGQGAARSGALPAGAGAVLNCLDGRLEPVGDSLVPAAGIRITAQASMMVKSHEVATGLRDTREYTADQVNHARLLLSHAGHTEELDKAPVLAGQPAPRPGSPMDRLNARVRANDGAEGPGLPQGQSALMDRLGSRMPSGNDGVSKDDGLGK